MAWTYWVSGSEVVEFAILCAAVTDFVVRRLNQVLTEFAVAEFRAIEQNLLLLSIIIYIKKLLNSDWLRKECSSSVTRLQTCNTSAKLVTRAQISNGFCWLKTKKKPPRTNQIRAVLTTKFKKMAMAFITR